MVLKKSSEPLPPIVRRGGKRKSQEVLEIIEALKDGSPYVLSDIEPGAVYNAIQQRIRQAARDNGIKVTIRHLPDEKELRFQGLGPIDDESEPEIEIKTAVKPAAKKNTKTTE